MWDSNEFEGGLKRFLGTAVPSSPANLSRAIDYAVFSGGKRFRPRLVSAAAESLGVPGPTALALGIAIELIHTYTLVHDDLPAMDDDDFRRGRPTLHRAFDEATALLAGDALIALGFDAVLTVPTPDAAAALRALRVLSEAAGARGVIAGQLLETEAATGIDAWLRVAELKTGALFRACLELPMAYAAQPPATLPAWGVRFGLAFQLADDLEDPEATASLDPKNIVRLEGRPATEARAHGLLTELTEEARAFPRNASLLRLAGELERKLDR